MRKIYLISVADDYLTYIRELLECAGFTVIFDGKNEHFKHLTRICIETDKDYITFDEFRSILDALIDNGDMYR